MPKQIKTREPVLISAGGYFCSVAAWAGEYEAKPVEAKERFELDVPQHYPVTTFFTPLIGTILILSPILLGWWLWSIFT